MARDAMVLTRNLRPGRTRTKAGQSSSAYREAPPNLERRVPAYVLRGLGWLGAKSASKS
jgi:hypothetical protein